MKKEVKNETLPEATEQVETAEPKYDSEYLQNIEDKRLQFFGVYRSQNRIKSIIFCLGLVIILLTFILVPNFVTNKNIQLPLLIGITVVALGLILAYTFITRKKMQRLMREYFGVFYGNINNYVFASKNYEDIQFENPGKIEANLFVDSQLYANVLEVRSRGATHFKYEKKQFIVCDCAGTYKSDKRVMPLFVGKYLVTGNSYKGAEPIFIYHKGGEKALPPNGLTDKKIVYEKDDLVIYSDNVKWNDVCTTEFIKKINSLKLNQELVDYAFAIHQGTTYISLGYDDPLMVVPLDQSFNQEPVKLYKKDLATACKIAKELD